MTKYQSNNFYRRLRNIEETFLCGREIVNKFPQAKLILLFGQLGAGKTSLVKGIAAELGITEPITSPTFSLSNHYLDGLTPLIHMDLYRLENMKSANELFLQEEEFAQSISGITVVEWSERLNLKLSEAVKFKIEYLKNDMRSIKHFND